MVEKFTIELMPVLILLGAWMSLGAGLGLPPWVLLLVAHLFVAGWVYRLPHKSWNINDIRFLGIPFVLIIIASWSSFHIIPAFHDQAYHLQISNRILNHWSWEPYHQGMDFSFRPELVSGVAAIELAWSGAFFQAPITPLLFLLGTAWTLQHLAEKVAPKSSAFSAPLAFVLLPIVVITGRTMMLDVAVSGAILCVLLIYINYEKHSSSEAFFLGVLSGCIGLIKYPYFYVGPLIALIMILSKQSDSIKSMIFGWSLIIGSFFLRNIMHTSNPFGPMSSQIEGTLLSATSEYGNYTFGIFLSEFAEQWPLLVLVTSLIGTTMLFFQHKRVAWVSWAFVLPAFILHGIILDFGWIRYQTPWLAILTLGLPIFLSSKKFTFEITSINFQPLTFIGVLVLILGVHHWGVAIIVEDDSFQSKLLTRESYSNVYINAGELTTDSDIVLAGSDITFGLYSKTETYRYIISEDPIFDSITALSASKVFTQLPLSRFSFESNFSYTLSSPIDPLVHLQSDNAHGYLWTVNESRLDSRDWWLKSNKTIEGDGYSYADMAILESNATIVWPVDTEVIRIISLGNEAPLSSVFTAMLGDTNDAELICQSGSECSSINRESHIEERWVIWSKRLK